jgi:tetratricopeptide (TPR) repeat protein
MLKPFSRLLRSSTAALALAFAVGAAAQEQPERNYQLSDDVSEVLGGAYRTATEAKNQAGALAAIEGAIAKVKDPTSFDMAVLLQIKAQTLLQMNEYARAIEPLERCLQLSDAKNPTYFDERITTELLYYLGALYMQEGSNSKDPKVVAAYFDKADHYMARWIKSIKTPTADALTTYASLVYTRATQDPDKPDMEGVKRALDVVERALRLSTRPKDNLYLLKFVCLQQLGRNQEAVELLELLVTIKPDNRTYWQQLAGLYLGQAAAYEGDPQRVYEYNIRTILAMERAQKHGFMNAPKDNFNLLGMHFNIGQYERAAELLEKGLRDGSIENEEKNWELLAFSYQQLNRDFKAIETLKEATKIFPKSAKLNYLIAQNYYAMEKLEEALPYLQKCVELGGGDKPHQTQLFLAYVAFELKKFDIALQAATKAANTKEGKVEGERMKKAIEDTLVEREARKQKI